MKGKNKQQKAFYDTNYLKTKLIASLNLVRPLDRKSLRHREGLGSQCWFTFRMKTIRKKQRWERWVVFFLWRKKNPKISYQGKMYLVILKTLLKLVLSQNQHQKRPADLAFWSSCHVFISLKEHLDFCFYTTSKLTIILIISSSEMYYMLVKDNIIFLRVLENGGKFWKNVQF